MIEAGLDDDCLDWSAKFSNDDQVQLKQTNKANKRKKLSKEHTRTCVRKRSLCLQGGSKTDHLRYNVVINKNKRKSWRSWTQCSCGISRKIDQCKSYRKTKSRKSSDVRRIGRTQYQCVYISSWSNATILVSFSFYKIDMKTKVSPSWIDQKVFDGLKSREKAYIMLLYEKKYTRKQIMQKLFIDNDRTFERLQAKISWLIKRHFVGK